MSAVMKKMNLHTDIRVGLSAVVLCVCVCVCVCLSVCVCESVGMCSWDISNRERNYCFVVQIFIIITPVWQWLSQLTWNCATMERMYVSQMSLNKSFSLWWVSAQSVAEYLTGYYGKYKEVFVKCSWLLTDMYLPICCDIVLLRWCWDTQVNCNVWHLTVDIVSLLFYWVPTKTVPNNTSVFGQFF